MKAGIGGLVRDDQLRCDRSSSCIGNGDEDLPWAWRATPTNEGGDAILFAKDARTDSGIAFARYGVSADEVLSISKGSTAT